MIDASHARAAPVRGVGNDAAERAQRTRDDNDFSVHSRPLRSIEGEAHYCRRKMTCNGAFFRGEMRVQRKMVQR